MFGDDFDTLNPAFQDVGAWVDDDLIDEYLDENEVYDEMDSDDDFPMWMEYDEGESAMYDDGDGFFTNNDGGFFDY